MFTLAKIVIVTVINHEKDRLKDRSRVNVIISKKLKESNKKINYYK